MLIWCLISNKINNIWEGSWRNLSLKQGLISLLTFLLRYNNLCMIKLHRIILLSRIKKNYLIHLGFSILKLNDRSLIGGSCIRKMIIKSFLVTLFTQQLLMGHGSDALWLDNAIAGKFIRQRRPVISLNGLLWQDKPKGKRSMRQEDRVWLSLP